MKTILTFAVILITAVTGFSQKVTDVVDPKNVNYEFLSQLVIDEVNKYRVDHWLHKLKISEPLQKDSKTWANYLAANNVLYHDTTGGFSEALHRGSGGGLGMTYLNFAKGVVNSWKDSPPHNAILLSSKSKYIGFGNTVIDKAKGWPVDFAVLRVSTYSHDPAIDYVR